MVVGKGDSADKRKKRVILFLSLEPPKVIEGTISLPSAKTRLSDLVNDDRPFLAVQDVTVPDGWFHPLREFMLLNKKEIKMIVEAEGV
jgi:hypothetical protein